MPKSHSALSVLSGRYKGQKIVSPNSSATHPMGAREKLALFNVLQPYLEGAQVLDTYAGSGALGIEALSRGAASVVFVERSHRVADVIRQNLAELRAKYQDAEFTAEVLARDLSRPEAVADLSGQFSLVLADPPYDHFVPAAIQNLVSTLQPEGILALSYPAKVSVPEFDGLKLFSNRRYAAAGIAIYQRD